MFYMQTTETDDVWVETIKVCVTNKWVEAQHKIKEVTIDTHWIDKESNNQLPYVNKQINLFEN